MAYHAWGISISPIGLRKKVFSEMIGILNYGVGNVQAFVKCYGILDIECKVVSSSYEVEDCTHLILPGVGSFDHAMSMFNSSGLRHVTEQHVLTSSKPILGVCVGMQMLCDCSQEGTERGLGLINGQVKKLGVNDLPLPHMGWNNVVPLKNHAIFQNADEGLEFYFLHSFAFSGISDQFSLGQTLYGEVFSSVISRDNIFGIQCHPEKSHDAGLTFLRNFARIK
jgi:glutamine amidotransferase